MRIKVFGERNTATNALCQIIKKNSASPLHPGTMRELDQFATLRTELMVRLGLKKSAIEACIDRVFSGRKATAQWKHAATNFERIEDFVGTHTIFTVRHPLSWLLSLHKNPYHALVEMPDTFEEFLRLDWKTVDRDRLDGKSLSPAALYEEKLRSYLHLAEKFDRANISYTFLKFEEVVTNQIGCFQRLSPYLENPAGEFRPLFASTKSNNRDLDYYREYYGNQHWRSEISEGALNRFSFDPTLIDHFGYE